MRITRRWRIVAMEMWDEDEADPASGRGWAMLTADGSLEGRIFFHMGDDSRFVAARDR